MDDKRLARAIESLVGETLARDIAIDFVKLRRDVCTGTLERTLAGKFVESFVQCLQKMSSSQHSNGSGVDDYLRNRVENDTTLPDGLRLCGSRVARSIYTMRNMRNIAHKGDISPNRIDLEYTHHAAAWIITELIRCATGVTMEEAGSLINLVNAPIGTLVEEIDGVPLVLVEVSMREEILLLLHRRYPDPATSKDLIEWTKKSASTIRSRLSELGRRRLIAGGGERGFKLTSTGHKAAVQTLERLQT